MSRKLTLALAVASVTGSAYVHWGHEVLLGLTSTAFALAVFWLAEPRRGAGGFV
jgi:hypothetical protein